MYRLIFLSQTVALSDLFFSENSFQLVDPTKTVREAKQFSFFTDPEEELDNDVNPEHSDPAEYYAKIQRKAQRRKAHGQKRIQGSFSSYKKSKNKNMKYAFLKPEVYKAEESKDCKPAPSAPSHL